MTLLECLGAAWIIGALWVIALVIRAPEGRE